MRSAVLKIALAVSVLIGGIVMANAEVQPRGWVIIETKVPFEVLNANLDKAIAANGMNLVNQASVVV